MYRDTCTSATNKNFNNIHRCTGDNHRRYSSLMVHVQQKFIDYKCRIYIPYCGYTCDASRTSNESNTYMYM